MGPNSIAFRDRPDTGPGQPPGTALPASAVPRAGHDQGLAPGRVLDCMAGVYASQSQAQETARQLQSAAMPCPTPGQVLHPAHASGLAFRRQARRWSRGRHADRQSWRADGRLMALLGGLVAGLAGAVWWLLADAQGTSHDPLLLLWPLLGGAALGWASAVLSPHPPQYLHFNLAVQRELAAGRWVVLARQVPSAQQSAVVALLRERSVGWCAVSAPWHSL